LYHGVRRRLAVGLSTSYLKLPSIQTVDYNSASFGILEYTKAYINFF